MRYGDPIAGSRFFAYHFVMPAPRVVALSWNAQGAEIYKTPISRETHAGSGPNAK
jgi:hypothetical protein